MFATSSFRKASQFIFILSLFTTLALTGCGGGYAASSVAAYDGTWTVSYNNPANIPAPQAVVGYVTALSCTSSPTTINIANSSGSVIQIQTCIVT